jgi:diguanylate cyclase (GGDEF)-like protein
MRAELEDSASGAEEGQMGGSRPLSALLKRPMGDPYAGADRHNAARIGALVVVLIAVLAGALLPVSPPTAELGSVGWAIAAADLLLGFVIAFRMARGSTPSFNTLYLLAFAAVAQITLLEWLAGGRSSPYHQLYLLPALFVSAVHPPRRVLQFLLFLTAAAFAPMLANGWSGVDAADTATQLLIIAAITVLTMVLMARVRAQRIALRDDGEFAKKLAHVDALTGLGNRRAFDDALERAIVRNEAADGELVLLMGDVNSFKEINDGFSHSDGDRCLRQVAQAINDTVRRADACFRWGGDEFAVLLADIDPGEANWVARRLEATVSRICRRPDGASIVLSWGLFRYERGMSAEAFLQAADEALLQRKSEGRLRSVAS